MKLSRILMFIALMTLILIVFQYRAGAPVNIPTAYAYDPRLEFECLSPYFEKGRTVQSDDNIGWRYAGCGVSGVSMSVVEANIKPSPHVARWDRGPRSSPSVLYVKIPKPKDKPKDKPTETTNNPPPATTPPATPPWSPPSWFPPCFPNCFPPPFCP